MITYNGIVSYFKEFANKHSQINSFTEGELDQIDLKKINEYPILHINVSGSTIEDNTITYDVDVHIVTSIKDDDNSFRIDSLSNMLLIMQDLRTEFFKGKYILNPNLQLRGSEELSCEPIDDNYNNRLYGWTTTLSVEGINESTQCNIPYPPIEIWNGTQFTSPVENMELFTWFSLNENLQENGNVALSNGKYQITKVKPFIETDNFDMASSPVLDETAGQSIKLYEIDKGGINLNVDKHSLNGGYSVQLKRTSNANFNYNTIGLKVSHIHQSIYGNNYGNVLCSIVNNLTTPTRGFIVGVGNPNDTNALLRNKIYILNVQTNVYTIYQDISDESTDYLREEELTIVIGAAGDNVSVAPNFVTLSVSGTETGVGGSVQLDGSQDMYLTIGANGFRESGSSFYNSDFIIKELTISETDGAVSTYPNKTDLYRWLKNR
tara:strand:+ start:3067 stop:4374 length:1308 start_codon:yes stop_codon:yes gene_type:complete